MLEKDAFDTGDVDRAMAIVPNLTNLRPSYVRAMAYEYESLAGYLHQRADDPILNVLGDHQPPAAVTGKDAPWRVPVHVIGRRDAALHRLVEHGFAPGLVPQQPSIGGMNTLVPVLLHAFDAPDPTTNHQPPTAGRRSRTTTRARRP
jgi:hypothetical protein